jgi:hypothetical protein
MWFRNNTVVVLYERDSESDVGKKESDFGEIRKSRRKRRGRRRRERITRRFYQAEEFESELE